MFKSKILNISLIILLLGCGNNENDTTVKANNYPPEINDIDVSLFSLKHASSFDLENHIKNGLYKRSLEPNLIYTLESKINDFSAKSTSVQTTNFSSTITQEEGVDEGDRVKYNGSHLYIANNQYNYSVFNDSTSNNPEKSTHVKILSRDKQGDLLTVAETVVYDKPSSIESLYLTNDTLAVFSNVYDFSPHLYTHMNYISDIFFPTEQKFNISLVDIKDPQSPNISSSFTIDGALLSSRRVDNTLYIVSSYTPFINDLHYAETPEDKSNNFNKIKQTSLNNLLPSYRNIKGDISTLIDANNCYIPKDSSELDGFDGLVTLTTINLNAPNEIESTCINAQVSGIYTTPNSVYLYGTQYSQTNEKDAVDQSIIHKFSISKNKLDYVASENIAGNFSWNNTSLRFSEQDDYLRVVTTQGNRNTGYLHKLNILKSTSSELELVTSLPNDTNPTLIGKLNEDGITQEEIKAVRYFNNKAFIVTFLNTDPLYVIDLTDNEKPYIAGALEIPGYSSYLHPISNNLLVGIGQNVDVDRISNSNNTSPIIEGAKFSLFDVSDITQPIEINSIILEGGYTPVEFDYHALTYLKSTDNIHKFSFPVIKWGTTTTVDNEKNEKITHWYQENFLALVEVSDNSSTPLLNHIGEITPITEEGIYTSGWEDRSILHNNDVYYIHGSDVWKSFWSDPKQISGSY